MSNRKNLSKELKLRIADIVILIVPEPAFPGFRLDDAYRPFITEGEPDVILRFHYGELTKDDNFGEKIFDSGSTWSFHRRDEKYLLRICYSGGNSTADKIAILEPYFRSGEVYVSNRLPNRPIASDPFLYPFAELLMINLLSLGRGTLFHACGVSEGDKGILFVGASGAGKSTLANLYMDKKDIGVLSDDRIIIRKLDGRFWIYGTPWHGDMRVCSPEKAPLERIFFLNHARENKVARIREIDIASKLLVCSFPTFWSKQGMEFTLNFCDELTKEIDCYELDFVPDESVIDFIKSI